MKTIWSGAGKGEMIFIFSNSGIFSSNLVIKIFAILTTKSVTLAPKDNCCFKTRKYSWQLWEDSQLDLESSFPFFLSVKFSLQ